MLALPWLNHCLSPGPATTRSAGSPSKRGCHNCHPKSTEGRKDLLLGLFGCCWSIYLFQGGRSVLSSFLLTAQKRPAELRGARMMGASGGVRMGVVSDVVSSASLSTSSKFSLTEGMICTTFS